MKETIGSTSEVSVKASIASGNRNTKMMTKIATSITPKQQAVTTTLQSCKTQEFGSNLPADGVKQTVFLLNLKLKPFGVFHMRKTLPCALDSNNIF